MGLKLANNVWHTHGTHIARFRGDIFMPVLERVVSENHHDLSNFG